MYHIEYLNIQCSITVLKLCCHVTFADAEDALSCSHSRSIYLFTESINSRCSFYGHPCSSLAALDSNLNGCLRCVRGVCPEMGYNADKSSARGSFYLRTRGSAPYCGKRILIQVNININRFTLFRFDQKKMKKTSLTKSRLHLLACLHVSAERICLSII